ncbi:MAG TPA: Zn-dependent alcohol dehydrogenase [Acidimicrobiales bacterium]|nr:Zn-dependent alcohol dehydrogenase [Acidimicrobiales bacterium]
MKAAVLHHSPGELSIEDVSLDKPGPREVLVRVAATGLCHSDLHYLERAYELKGPMILGHEGAGRVEAVGSDVTYVRPGDHVIAYLAGFCGSCEWCLAGRMTLCPRVGLSRGNDEAPRIRLSDGRPCLQFAGLSTFAEEMLIHENTVVKIDPDIPLDRAALVGCAVPTGVGAVIRTAKVTPGATVAVIGCGGVGLNCIQGAVIAGARRIVAIDINDGKLATARDFGATDTINNSDGTALEQLDACLPGEGGVDYSFEALGSAQTYELAFSILRPGGTATVIGVASGTFTLPTGPFLAERRIQGCIMGSVRFRQDLPYLLDLYRAGRLKLDELVSKRIPLEQINEGYAAISDGSVARSVVVFD